MAEKIDSYRDLRVWSFAMDIAVACYELTQRFPKQEMYGLTSQIRRAAASIAANIAEGHGRETSGAFAQGLRVAQGSLKELETHLSLAERVGLCGAPEAAPLLQRCDELGRMLRALIRSIQRGAES